MVHQGKIYVFGGLMMDSEISRQVDVLDPATGKWTTAPELPGVNHNGFAPPQAWSPIDFASA